MKMTYYEEPARKIPVIDTVDVLVAGSGPAGFSAAVCAARQGARVMLIEALGTVGGIATSGMMSHFTGSVKSEFYEELLGRMMEKRRFPDEKAPRVTIDPEQLKQIELDMLNEAGVKLRLYTFVSGAIVEDGAIRGVILESKSGREAVMAKIVIDATGDGDVAARAGVPFWLGREEDHLMQPVTIMFKVAGVDTDRAVFPGSFETTVETEKGELQALAKEKLPFPAGHVLLYRTTLPGVVTLNMTNAIGIDGTSADDLTRGEMICRSQMEAIVSFLREYAPGYENCYQIGSASLLGVRETRHFKGEYTLTSEDVLSCARFDDWVVREARFNFDVHNLTGASLDRTGAQKHFPKDNQYEIPYRCLIPQGIDNLLLAGRCISGTHMAHSNYRVMPMCVAMGEAAGCAAALAVRQGVGVRAVDARDIQALLTQGEK